ncbi:MAG: SGNH/GDSL hydrolase family protein [Lachnospiraceae bacterium]|nr:SGNH/GDSL hydrolase family protein [Lachnospiraceae bacterium]
MTKIKRHKTIAFLGILFLLLLGVTAGIGKTVSRGGIYTPHRYSQYYGILQEPEESIDLVVMGDSLGYAAVSPMTLWKENGIASYICAQPGQFIPETCKELTGVLGRQKPKVVILETNLLFSTKSGKWNPNDSLEGEANYRVPLYRGHDFWKVFVLKSEREKTAEEEGRMYKGYTLHCAVAPYEGGDYMKEMPDTVPEDPLNPPDEISRSVKSYMEKIIRKCRSAGTEVLLVSTPSPSNNNLARHNAVSAYAEEAGLQYLDMNLLLDEIGIDWATDSLDNGDHVNVNGSIKVSEYLGGYLAGQYSLPDHRGEKAYESWNEENVRFEEDVQNGRKWMGLGG